MIHLPNRRKILRKQRGQSIAEVMISLPFMMAIVIGLVDMGIAFASYIAQVNAAREGAVFASKYNSLADSSCESIQNPDCVGAQDDQIYGGSTTLWDEYYNRVANELYLNVGEQLRARQLLTQDDFTLSRPVLNPSACRDIGCPITVTIYYRIHTLTSDMQVPYFGRFGLPNYYQLNYSMSMPIR